MSMSSLLQQLNQFKQKQKADPKLPDNSSATFLFDFRTANKIDKEMIFTLGYEGIKELARLDRKFIKYFEKLFNNTSKYFQRETKLKSELSEIDFYLENLIVDLIDYFHLKPTHKVIEYLIKIFNINAYNPKFLVLAFLPFHESKYYIKLLQNLNLELNQNFKFLTHFSKTGTVVLEELLFKEIFNNFDLIKEIFNYYEEKIIKNSQNALELKKNNSEYAYQNSYNSMIESEKYFKFLSKLIKYFFGNLGNNKRIDKSNFFILILNFIRINIKNFSLVNEYANTKLNNGNSFNVYFSSDNFNRNGENDDSGEINYIIKEICELVVLMNSKYRITNEYANALLNDILNNFLFFKNTKNLNSVNGEVVNSNNRKSAEFVLTSILLFVNEFENKENNPKTINLGLDKETLELFFDNIRSFNFATNAKSKKGSDSKQKQSKTVFAAILENLSNEFNFYPFLKLIVNSVFTQLDLVFAEADKQLNYEFSNVVESSQALAALSNNVFQALNFIKIQKSELFSLCEYLMSLDDSNNNDSLTEILHSKISLLNSFKNKNNKEEITLAISKLVERSFIHLENLYVDDFNSFLIKLFEATKKTADKSRITNYLKGIENYKLLSSNEDNLFDLFINLNTTNVNSVANSIEKIDALISEDKGNIVKFTYNALIGKFTNLDQEFLLKKIIDMKNFSTILNEISSNNANNEKYKKEFLEFYFRIYEEKIGLYSNEFLERLNLFVLANFISDPNEDLFNRYFVYFYAWDLKIPEEKLNDEIKHNKFLSNLIADNLNNNKKMEEFVKTLSCSNSIKSISHIFSLIKILFEKKSANNKIVVNLITLVNKIHLNENSKFKNNCSTSPYLKLVGKIIEILNFLNLEIFSFNKNSANNKNSTYIHSTIGLMEDMFYEISDNLISNIFFHRDFLACISQIAFLILNSPAQRIRALFDKIINFVFEPEIFHFITYLILTDKSALFEDTDEKEVSEMNIIFNNNILDYISRKIIKTEDAKKSSSAKPSIDFGFVLALIYILNELEDNNSKKKIFDIFDSLNSQRDNIEISFLHYNSLFGLVASASPNKIPTLANSKDVNKSNSIFTDLIGLISGNKNEIFINKNNLQKIFNNSKNVDFNLYLIAFDYFVSYSDEFTDFSIFYKSTNFIVKKLENNNSNKSSVDNKKENKSNLDYSLEYFNEQLVGFICDLIFSESIKNNPSQLKLQEEVISNVLDFFHKEEKCLSFIINKLLQNKKINQEVKYSQTLIRKVAESNLLQKINFTKSSINKSTEKTDMKNSSSKKVKKESEDLYNKDKIDTFDLVEFVNLIIQFDLASSDIANVIKINYLDILIGLLDGLKAELSQKNQNSNKNKTVNIRDTIFFIYEMILKGENFSLAYSLKTLEFLETLSSFSEIDSNFLIMSNNLFSLLTHTNADSEENEKKDSEVKSICEKIEAVILKVCEILANKQKTMNEEFYITNTNRTFSTQIYEEVVKMEKENPEENKMQEEELIEGEEVVANAMSYSYEYLNILNTLFLSLNKAIIFQSKKEFERDIVLRVINKAFEIFYGNNQKIVSCENSEDLEMENEIGYKFKKDIFSVILNSIINFVTSLLSHRSTTEIDDLDLFYEYIQTLVKLTIKNFNDDIYLDNILKKFLELIKPFDNRLISCLFVTIYYYNIENNFEKFLEKKETIGSSSLIEQFSKFFEFEKEQNSYYNRLVNSYFEDILELNYQKFDENSVTKVLLILEEILNSISNAENENNKINVYFILHANDHKNKNKICFFENLRNLIINLCIKILSQIKNLFYLNESQKLKENVDVYSIVLSINNKILKCYKLSNQILNKNKENKSNENSKNQEVKALLTNVFNKNLKTFEDNFFEIIIEANILHYLIVNIFDKIENEKEQILLRNFLLQKYFNLVKSDSESIQDTNIVSKNAAKSKKKVKTIEHYQAKFNDNLVVFNKLLLNFDQENSKNYENINLIFSVLTEIIIFTEKFSKLNHGGKSNLETFNIIKGSKRLDLIISKMSFDDKASDDKNSSLPFSFYSSKFSIFNFMVKFFTLYELKFFELFNKFISNVQNYLDVSYHKFFFNSNNNENKEILVSVLKSIYELVNSRSEFMSPIIEPVIFKISLLYEENLTAEVINRIFDTLAKKQLFDLSFKAVKFAFKNYDKLITEKNKYGNSLIDEENKHNDAKFLTYKGISTKIKAVLGYLNTAIKHSDKLVITDMNLSILKFIYRILMNKNYNNNNTKNDAIKSIFIKNEEQDNIKDEISQPEDKITNLSDSILSCLRSLILKMNEKQFKVLFEEFLFAFFKEEIDPKNHGDLDIEKVGNKYKLNNCIVTLQVFNEIFECLNSIFVGYFEKYKNVLIQIFNHISSVFCDANKNSNKKKKDRNHFEEKFDDENNKFSYLNLSSLAMRNISLALKYDKSILMQETIQEFFEPISYQLKFIYFTESKYQAYFDTCVKLNLCEIYKNIKTEDLFRELNEMILNLIREDHYQIRLFVIKLFNHLFSDLKDKLILHIHDIIPYITESLEDQNEKVQIEAFNLIKLIEKQTGEDIKNYIES